MRVFFVTRLSAATATRSALDETEESASMSATNDDPLARGTRSIRPRFLALPDPTQEQNVKEWWVQEPRSSCVWIVLFTPARGI
jgi:hypothetical protein